MSETPSKLICKLGEILKERGISANKLSIDINHRRGAINDLINNKEMDRRRIPATLIADICNYLKITPNDLFEVVEGDMELNNEFNQNKNNTYEYTLDENKHMVKEIKGSNGYLRQQIKNKDLKTESLLTSRTTINTSIKNELYISLENLSKTYNIPIELLIDEAIELLLKQKVEQESS